MLKFACRLTSPTRRSISTCHVNLSGHNKWSKIKQKKGANDAQKSVVFGKASRDIGIAVRSGGGTDPTKNLQLAAVLKWAKEMDVPKENIEKALAKASQTKDQAGDTFTYEVLAFNSVGIIIECVTDNSNRTVHHLREILNGYGARAAPVKFMFRRQAYINMTPKPGFVLTEDHEDQLINTALDNGVDNFEEPTPNRPSFRFTCQPDMLQPLRRALTEHYIDCWDIEDAEIKYVPAEADTELISEETKSSLKDLISDLEANDDVYQIYTSLPDDDSLPEDG